MAMPFLLLLLLQQLWAVLLMLLDYMAEVPGLLEAVWQILLYFVLLGLTIRIRQTLRRGQGTEPGLDECPSKGSKSGQETVSNVLLDSKAMPTPPTTDLATLKLALGILGLQNQKAHLRALNTQLDEQIQRLQQQFQEDLGSHQQRLLELENQRAEEEARYQTISQKLIHTCQNLDSALQARERYRKLAETGSRVLDNTKVCHLRERHLCGKRAQESQETGLSMEKELQERKTSNGRLQLEMTLWEAKFHLSPHGPAAPGALP